MPTLLISHPDSLTHDTGDQHPERIERIRAIDRVLEAERFSFLVRQQAPLAEHEMLARVHRPDYVESVLAAIPDSGSTHLDADTIVSPGSGNAALRAAGAACLAVDAVLNKEVRNAFCALRPPGHHAEPHRAMGFCLFNSIAVGAAHALAIHGLERVAMIDFDVHHGNGTQAMTEAEPGFFYVSTHQSPLYPGTGDANETGTHGNIANFPMPAGSGRAEIEAAFVEHILPALYERRPELIMISAGFDAHELDPLGAMRLSATDFAWMTRCLLDVAEDVCGGRVVSILEGGYDLTGLSQSVAAHVDAMMV